MLSGDEKSSVLIINEKPSVSQDFKKALMVQQTEKTNGYIEGYSSILDRNVVITWCVGHLVEMCYPDKYDESLKDWRLETLPFLPEKYKYEVIQNVKKQFDIVKKFLVSMENVYYAGDSGREGIYIQALVRQMSGRKDGGREKVVWIDSYTVGEIRRGIRDAMDYSEYAPMISSGYERAVEDYSVGINFSRALTIKYAGILKAACKESRYIPISVGRVMTCVLGMIVSREREIQNFKPTPFFRIIANLDIEGTTIKAEWRIPEGSRYFDSPLIYENTGFKKKADAEQFMKNLPEETVIDMIDFSVEKKKAPALFNLAELQSECAKKLHISPAKTLEIAQHLYEKKLTTYPRTDARVLSTAVANEIEKNITGLSAYEPFKKFCDVILDNSYDMEIGRYAKYVDDSKITDHYAIIPTGVMAAEANLSDLERKVYNMICVRFLSIFYPPAEYQRVKLQVKAGEELFTSQYKLLLKPGYYEIAGVPDEKEKNAEKLIEVIKTLKDGMKLPASYSSEKGETAAPRRYTSGSIVLAMENAGQLIEDEELREQIKKTGIGTSATRADTLLKLIRLNYINQNEKTQVLTPTNMGNMIYEVVRLTVPSMLNPEFTANWEKGLENVKLGKITGEEYRRKSEDFVRKEVNKMKEEDLTKEVAGKVRKYAVDKNFKADSGPFESKLTNIKCPMCEDGMIRTTPYGYCCSNHKKDEGCGFAVGMISGVNLSERDLKSLVENGRTRVISGFEGKGKKKFDAILVYGEEDGKLKLSFDFSENRADVVSGCRCPKCRGKIEKYPFGYKCENNDKDDEDSCSFFIGKISGKSLSEKNIVDLLTKGVTGSITGFKSKNGKKFSAALKMDKSTGKLSFVFPERKPAEESSLLCPYCQKPLMRDEWKYSCDCGYKIPHVVAKKQLTENQVGQMINNGQTGKIDGFISKKGKKFAAVLKADQDGNITFDFGD